MCNWNRIQILYISLWYNYIYIFLTLSCKFRYRLFLHLIVDYIANGLIIKKYKLSLSLNIDWYVSEQSLYTQICTRTG